MKAAELIEYLQTRPWEEKLTSNDTVYTLYTACDKAGIIGVVDDIRTVRDLILIIGWARGLIGKERVNNSINEHL